VADCCEQIRSELAALKAEVAKLKPVDEQRIIKASVAEAQNLIIPAVLILISQKLAPIFAKIDALAALINIALNTAKAASAAAAAAASKVAALAAAIAGILLSIAAIQVLGSRIDAVENGVYGISSDMSRLWGTLGAVKGIAEGARDTANRALGRADQADSTANKAIFKADNATTKAQQAIERANTAIERANTAIEGANDAQTLAIQAGQQAREAAIRANTAVNTANLASSKADQAINDAKAAVKRANEIAVTAQKALTQSEQAINDAKTAIKRANEIAVTAQKALTQSEQAINDAKAAIKRANEIAVTAQKALTQSEQAISTATNAQQISNAAIGLGVSNNIEINNTNAQVSTLRNDLNTFEGRARQWNEEQRQLSEQFITQLKQGQATDSLIKQGIKDVDDKVNAAIKETEQWNARLREFKGDVNSFEGRAYQWNQQQIAVSNNFLKQLREGQATDALIKQGIREVDEKVNKSITEAEAWNERLTNTNNKIGAIASAIPGIQGRLDQVEAKAAAIPGIQAQTRENERLNREGLNKLDQIIPNLAGVPAATAALVRPAIPTLPQIRTAAASGVCQTAQPGGCLNTALNNQTGNILNGLKNNLGNVLGGANAAANAAQLAILNTINSKLGEQIVGGIGGKLSKISQFLQLGRVLDALTFAATVHNALMLSNDIGQTLLGIIGNILQLIGIKDDEGNAINVGGVIGGSVENLIKGAIGAENYTELKESFAKANRIYQASVNVLNAFQNAASTIINALEVTIGRIGKIGNALRASGEVLENAYSWMNPQPKINRFTQFLEGLQNGASTIQMVTQAPLDVINATTELTNAATEFNKSFKEDDKPENKANNDPEPDKLKADKDASKQASAGKDMTELDLEADEAEVA
jgi:hypothetical protein